MFRSNMVKVVMCVLEEHSTGEDINSTSLVSDLDAYSMCFQDGFGST